MTRQWFYLNAFPSPGIPLLVRLDDGTEIKAIRPKHVSSYNSDPEFFDEHDNPIPCERDDKGNVIRGVKAWSIF